MNFDSLPGELQQLLAAEMKDGTYDTPADALVAGMRLLREKREEEAWVKREVQIGLDQLERGEYVEFNNESLRDYFEQLKQRAREVAIRHGTQDL
jgi:Arc/MetJ-type ribon-helix-helix transcriptional regulator